MLELREWRLGDITLLLWLRAFFKSLLEISFSVLFVWGKLVWLDSFALGWIFNLALGRRYLRFFWPGDKFERGISSFLLPLWEKQRMWELFVTLGLDLSLSRKIKGFWYLLELRKFRPDIWCLLIDYVPSWVDMLIFPGVLLD